VSYEAKPLVRRRLPLGGKVILAAGYDRDTETLEARLASGRVVRYEGVAQVTFCELVNAEDVDRYFSLAIQPYCRATVI
jgi:hypothetical protein